MKKIIVLMTSLLLLTGYVQSIVYWPEKEKTSQSNSRKKNPSRLSGPSQYKDQDNRVLEASEKFIKETQRLEAGKLFVFSRIYLWK